MDSKIKKACVFCCKVSEACDDPVFFPMDEILLEILDFLALSMKETPKNSAVCKSCKDRIDISFNFKSTCLEVEDSLVPLFASQQSEKLDLINIVTMEGRDGKNCSPKNLQACRLCKTVCNDQIFESLTDMLERGGLKGVFKKHFSEFDLEATKNPVVCIPCQNLFVDFCDFLSSIYAAEEYLVEEKYFDSESRVSDKLECQVNVAEADHAKSKEKDNTGISETNPKRKKRRVIMYQCPDCPYQGNGMYRLSLHRRTHMADEMETYKCHNCSYESVFKSCLKKHMERHQKMKVEVLKCPKCEFQTKNSDSLKKHTDLHEAEEKMETFRCERCSYRTIFRLNMTRHKRTAHADHPKKIYICYHCSYQSANRDVFKGHVILHQHPDKRKSHRCDKCDYSSHRLYSLQKHMEIHQQNRQVFKCHDCPTTTMTRASLARHVQLVHSSLGKLKVTYKCTETGCKFVTKYKTSLDNHTLLHSGQVYKCSNCNYKTKYKHYLKVHSNNLRCRFNKKTNKQLK